MYNEGQLKVEGLRTAALELQALDNHEVVKIAGVFRKIKNWWKAFTSPEYREQIDALKGESAQVKYLLETLNKEIDRLQLSIADTDVASYEESLGNVREMTLQLSKELASLRKETVKADKQVPVETSKEPARQEQPEVNLPRGATGFYQTEESRRDPKARAEMFKLLPDNYDVPIGDRVNKKWQDINWFKAVSPNQIQIGLENWRSFMLYYKNMLMNKFGLAENQAVYMVDQLRKEENIKQLSDIVKNAIMNGFVLRNNLPKTQENSRVQHRPINQMDVVVTADPFPIPGTTMQVTALFGLTDMMASGGHGMKLKWTQRMNYVNGSFDVSMLPPPEMPEEKKELPKPEEKKNESKPEAKKSKKKATEQKKESSKIPPQPMEAAVNLEDEDDRVDYPDYPEDFDDYPEYWDSDYALASKLVRFNELMKFALSKTSAEVQKQKTIYRGEQLATTLRDGFRAAFGHDPTAEELGAAWSQAMTEQGGSFNNNNFGNVTATKGWIKSGGDYFVVGNLQEFDESGNVISGVNQMPFRSYRTGAEGAADYWKVLARNHSNALRWFATGDALSSALALSDSRYYTGNRKVYSGNMTQFFDQFMTNIAPKLGLQPSPAPDPGEKPVYKPYAKSEQAEPIPDNLQQLVAKHTGRQPANESADELTQEYEQTMKQLFASGPIEGFVRRALERAVLPNTAILLVISSEEPHYVQVRYAHVLVSALRSELGAESSIHDNGKKVEIESDIAGTNGSVMLAAQALADGISNAFEMATHGMSVKAVAWDGLKSSYGLLESETSENSFRKFAFKVMNG